MRSTWGKPVGSRWEGLGQPIGLSATILVMVMARVHKLTALDTVFAHISTAVAHSCFVIFSAVSPLLSPTFHSTYKDNYKVYKLVIS
jgi:hypothetical protein